MGAKSVRCSGNGRVKCCIKLSRSRWYWQWSVWLVLCVAVVCFSVCWWWWCVVSFVLFHANSRPEVKPPHHNSYAFHCFAHKRSYDSTFYIYIFVFYLYVLYIVVCDQADRAHCLAVVLRSISVSRILMISPHIRLPSLFREANTIKSKAKSKWKSHFGICKCSQNKAALHLDSHLSNGDLCLLSVSVEVPNIYSIYSTVSFKHPLWVKQTFCANKSHCRFLLTEATFPLFLSTHTPYYIYNVSIYVCYTHSCSIFGTFFVDDAH